MKWWPKRKHDDVLGTLRIDKSDPDDGPFMFLELDVDPRIIERQKYITLRVSTESYLAQK